MGKWAHSHTLTECKLAQPFLESAGRQLAKPLDGTASFEMHPAELRTEMVNNAWVRMFAAHFLVLRSKEVNHCTSAERNTL